jgi:hypothetical protein
LGGTMQFQLTKEEKAYLARDDNLVKQWDPTGYDTLMQVVKDGGFTPLARVLGISRQGVENRCKRAAEVLRRAIRHEAFLKLPASDRLTASVECLHLTNRTFNVLNKLEIRTVGDLLNATKETLLSTKACGVCSLINIDEELKRHGLERREGRYTRDRLGSQPGPSDGLPLEWIKYRANKKPRNFVSMAMAVKLTNLTSMELRAGVRDKELKSIRRPFIRKGISRKTLFLRIDTLEEYLLKKAYAPI